MRDRFRAALTSVLMAALASAALAPAAAAQSSLRTPDGHPDLQGLWNFSTATPMQRPEELAGRTALSAEEAAEYEQAIWFEQGNSLERQRTSLIIAPPNGRIPAVRPDAAARTELTRLLRGRHAHGPEDRGVSERCLLGFNSGPPMTPSVYNNNMQLFQTADHVVILNEMVHNARIVPLDGRSHLPAGLRQWVGDSRASWQGDTLVVETTNFLRETSFGGSSANLHLVERFSRIDADTLRYEFTVSDPTTWAGPWTARVEMKRTDEPLYEYACHEGNYSMASSLSGARTLETAEGGSN